MPKKLTKEQFVEKAIIVHSNLYDYSKFIYINSHEKGTIICKKHGDFEQSPNNHLNGNGCPKCAGNSKSNLEEFIEKAKVVHKDGKYTYDKFVYVNSDTKSTITCENHRDFEQTPTHHLNGKGCPECSKEKRRELFKSNLEEFIEKANKIHKNSLYKYSYDKFEYINAITKGIVTCEEHGDFMVSPNHHLSQKQGCPKCRYIKSGNSNRKGNEDFIEKAKIVHNNFYDYSKVDYVHARKKVIVTCPIHGDFEITPANHKNKKGCPKCADEKRKLFRNIRWEEAYESGILYLIECWNDVERFIKIGVTASSVEERFRRQRDMPYNYKVLEEIPLDSKSCIEYEQHILEISESYKPKINFGGDSECLSIDEKYYLQDFLKPLINI